MHGSYFDDGLSVAVQLTQSLGIKINATVIVSASFFLPTHDILLPISLAPSAR
jgi:hypothetical protein